jgi:hypothetical protein
MHACRLTPGTKYYYQCGTTDGGYSAEQTFTAPPTPGPNVITKILAFGGERSSLLLLGMGSREKGEGGKEKKRGEEGGMEGVGEEGGV